MRRRAMQMTMVAVLVSVVVLGLPLGCAWVILSLRSASTFQTVDIKVTYYSAEYGRRSSPRSKRSA